ncbi:hypothetical protein PPTG_19685, partial [Phytophthora nicotianae INRA-310]
MVAISDSRNEDSSPTIPKKLSRHLLHLVSRAQMSPREAVREPPRSLWRQALIWPSSPALLKKNARVAALERSHRGSSNQNEPCVSSSEIQSTVDTTVFALEQQNDQPQDKETHVLQADKSISPRKAAAKDNNLLDLSSSVKKPELSVLKLTQGSAIHATTSASSLKVLQSSLPEPPLNIVKRASLYEELREF